MKPCLLILLMLLLAACAAPPDTTAPLTLPPNAFPTVTPGRMVQGPLPTPVPTNPNALDPAQAGAVRPFPTPNRAACPQPDAAAVLGSEPATTSTAIAGQLAAYFTQGGSTATAEAALRQRGWIGANDGFVRGELDMTSEGHPEPIAAFRADDGGALVIFACADGSYQPAYTFVMPGTAVPQLITTNDLNFDQRPDLLFALLTCGDAGRCHYAIQVAAWNAARSAFVNLLAGPLTTATLPTVEDYDQDHVLEIIVRHDDDGDASTGPLRTGFSVYDWNGTIYTRSITQLNPPRYRIQVLQQADTAFDAGQWSEAAGLYTLGLSDPNLAEWINDDDEVLRAYALYRLVLTYAAIGDPRAGETVEMARATFPDIGAAPVYHELLEIFWTAYSPAGSAVGGCAAVNAIIPERPAAVDRLNRYGSASPSVTGADLCPF